MQARTGEAPTGPGPLEDVRVVELGNLIAGPLAAAHLAALGADVVKVEPPGGDAARAMRSLADADVPAPFLLACNQGKRSVVLDLKSPDGLAAVRRLIAGADVVVENYRDGAMARLGLDPSELVRDNPRLVYVALRGFGPAGPLAAHPAVDGLVQAATGMVAATGDPAEVGTKAGYPVVDHASAHLLVEGALAALLRRHRTGRGELLTFSLYEAALMLQATHFTDYLVTGVVPPRSGNAAPTNAPTDLYRTGDGAVFVSAYLDRHWAALGPAIGRPDLVDDERFADRPHRVSNQAALKVEIEAALAGCTTAEVVARLEAAGLMVTLVADYADVAASAQVEANGIVGRSRGPDGTVRPALRSPLRALGGPVDLPVPALGEHTVEVLREVGLDQAAIARIVEGVSGYRPGGQ